MLRRSLKAEGVLFETAASSLTVHFPLSEDAEWPADVRQLEALWLAERVDELAPASWLLPWRELYALEEQEAELLQLPNRPDADLRLSLSTFGAIRDPDFRVRLRAQHPRHGILPDQIRRGPAFILGDGTVLLAPPDALALIEFVDGEIGPDIVARLLYVGRVRKAALQAGVTLDYYLEHEDILVPDGIGVDAEVLSPDELRIRPVLEGAGMEAFNELLAAASGPARSGYTRIDGPKRRRVVLDPNARSALDDVLSRGVLRGHDVPRFLSNPEAYLPEAIDLSRFSERVRGLIPRRYTSQPYVRAQRKGRDWFTISAEVELAGELAAIVGTSESTESSGPAETGSGPGSRPELLPAQTPPSVSPAEYAEMCKHVVKTGETWVRHGDDWIEIDRNVAEDYVRLWEEVEQDDDGSLRVRAEMVVGGSFILDVISNVDDAEFVLPGPAELLESIPEYPLPTTLRAELLTHQRVGYNWLRFLGEQKLGGLLADDMGLGKTVQVVSFFAHLAHHGLLRPTLVVVPAALMNNWHREIKKFCPDINVVYHHVGPERLRSPVTIAQSQIVLTTYQTLRRDQLLLGQIDWQVVVSDEAQYVKNPTAQSTAVLKAMKAGLRLALTGTPVENGLSELWCIVDFVQPGRLGSQKEFRNEYEYPMRDAPDVDAQLAVARRLQERLTPHYIRREKEHVLKDLPSRTDVRLEAGLGPRQKEYYGAVIKHLREGKENPISALPKLLAISSHPELYMRSGCDVRELIEECPKLQLTVRILENIHARAERVLLFTRFKAMQTILQDVIEDVFGRHAPIINGEVDGGRRLDAVDRFNGGDGFGAMILSPEAAGVGLNITGANHVVHYTRLWNPAKENQATDRVHRLGQQRPVTVYYPIVTADPPTVEERLDELLREKLMLARNVVWPRSRLDVQADIQAWLAQEGAA
jgi:superfamily II DNA or RNA helicase